MKDRPRFQFRLYVTGNSPNSTLAIQHLNALCQKYLPDRHEIEIVDVLAQPRRALAEGVVLTPTLVKIAPPPVRKVIGNLSQTQRALVALGLPD
jgi:circadian clock protein KaiB